MLTLTNLKPAPGARKRRKRVGCGEGSGHGKTSGRGHKGQKARSGGTIRLGFEGGQMPLLRKMPKRGFNNNRFKTKWAIVNVGDLENFDANTSIDETLLRHVKLVRGRVDGIKVLGDGELTKVINIKVDAISAGAREKIEKAGGKVELTGKFADEAPAAK
jgi:large subunit ribosomal protein L15